MSDSHNQTCLPCPPFDVSSGLSTLEFLPLEIRSRIASFLTVKDARSLILVSRHLQDVAESVIYQNLDLRLKTEDIDDTCRTKSLEKHMHDRFLKVVSATLANLLSKPARSGLARKLVLRLPVDEDLDKKQLDIIAYTRHYLTTLRILPSYLPWGSLYFPVSHQITEPLPRLVVLEYVQPSSMTARNAFEAAISLAPNVQRLSISNLHHALRSKEDELKPGAETLMVTCLESLYLSVVVDRTLPFVAYAVAQSPALKKLSVKSCGPSDGEPTIDENDPQHEKTVQVIRQHPCVARLEWIEQDWELNRPIMWLRAGLENLRLLVMRDVMAEETDTYIENITIPQLPNLEVLMLVCRDSNWLPRVENPKDSNSPAASIIESHTISQVSEAPSLLAVLFVSEPLRSLPIHDILDSMKWCDKRINGVMLRTYSNAQMDKQLFHFRRLQLREVDPTAYSSPHWVNSNGQMPCDDLHLCTGVDHFWADHTFYEGYAVPPDLLEELYHLTNEERQWSVPGRALYLPNAAWEMLRKWRLKLPEPEVVTRKPLAWRLA